MSYSNPTQHPTSNFPNGIPPQIQQQLPGQQKFLGQPNVMQTIGTNKYMPPGAQYLPQCTTSSSSSMPYMPQMNSQSLHQQNSMPQIRSNYSLTNGGSSHSSRTASPAMNSSYNQQFNKTHLPPAPTSTHNLPCTTSGFISSPGQFATSSSQNLSKLNDNMQNVSLKATASNGPVTSLSNVSQTSQPPATYQNFKSEAVNMNTPHQNISHHQLSNNQSNYSFTTATSAQSVGQASAYSGASPQSIYGVPPNNFMDRQHSNQNVIPPASASQSSSISNSQLQSQHIANNNPSQAQIPPSQQLPKKVAYPTPNVSQQSQPYSQAYQHQSPQQQQRYPQPTFNGQANTTPLQYQQVNQTNYNQMSVTQQGFNRLWGQDTLDLMQHRHILPHEKVQPPRITLNNQFHESVNCNPDIMRCTLTKIPESNNLLQKSRLPLGILVHPFRDINSLPVIQCPNIVRCRLCRTYINPFVYFVDSKMWKCNLCYRVNELPEDFQYDPATKTFGDVTRRPEVRSSTIEFIAPSEYMLRPPQPAIYLFLFDVSILAQQSGYLENVCSTISKHLDDMPGDARTQVGFIAYNSEIHFYNIAEGYNQPHEMTLVDIEDAFLPCPDNLLVNLNECKELIKDLLGQLPTRFANSHDPGSALGAALQVAYKLMSASGGRITVFQTCLPNNGPGALQSREDPNNRSSKEVLHLNPATDFYKKYALECSGYQIAVDIFLLNQQYSDLATISGISKYSGGSIHHFPLYQKTKPQHVDALKQCLRRYLTRKIGFEAVMRIRCTRGLQVHTFHGNSFVRSTDLLSLPNVNPDSAYGMQISYEESLTDIKTICFQAALLYTNSEGERRIRVHTLCLPVTSSLCELMHSADSESIVSLLSKMAVDRSLTTSVSDAREAFINATIDVISAFRIAQNLPQGQTGQLIVPRNLSLMPLYISALLKNVAFRTGTSTRLDDRIAAMDAMKTLPLDHFMKYIYPEFYIIDCLFYNVQNSNEAEEEDQQQHPPLLHLSAEFIDSRSMFLLDCGTLIIIYVGMNVPPKISESVLGVQSTADIPDYYFGLPSLNTPESDALKNFINHLNEDKPYLPTIQIIRDTSTCRTMFIEKLIDDRSESSLSYYEFLQHLRSQVK